MALSYVQTHDDWRTARLPGNWVTDQSLAGGTFTIRGDDGEDTNGDGVVEGDGSFTDDTMDLLTLTATANYRGTVHSVRAVVPPHKLAAMIVANPDSLASEDTDRYTLLRNWGWRVQFMKASGLSTDFDTAVAGVHVIYVPAHCTPGFFINSRLSTTNLPIVSENLNMGTVTKVASLSSNTWSGTTMDVLPLTRTVTDDGGNPSVQSYTHYITSVFPTGSLTVCGSSTTLSYAQGTLLGAQVLANRTGQPTQPALVVLETGSLQTDGMPSPARRVLLPWGGDSGTFTIGSLNSNGQNVLRRALDWAGSSWRGPVPGVAVWDTARVSALGLIDGYYSSAGPYGGLNINGLSVVSTNSLMTNALKLSGGLVKGSAFVSPQANVNQVVNVLAGASLTGSRQNLTLNVPIPNPQPPSGMGASIGDRTYSSGIYTVSGDVHFGQLTIKGTAVVKANGATRIYCDKGLTLGSTGAIVMQTITSTLALYTAGPVSLQGSGGLGTTTADPTRIQWFILNGDVQVGGETQVYALTQSYDGTLTLGGGSQYYGTFVGKRVVVSGSAAFHVDTSNSATVSTLGGGFDLSRVVASGVRWVEMH
jgi:hypothetical protein